MFKYKSGNNTITRRYGLLAKPCNYTSELLTCFNDYTINLRSLNTFTGMSICDRPVSQYSGGYNYWSVSIVAPTPFLMAPCAGKFGNKIINPIYHNNEVSNKYLIEFCPAKQLNDNISYTRADDLWTRYIMYYDNNRKTNGLANIGFAPGHGMAAITANYNGSIIRNTYGTLPSMFDSINFINGGTQKNNAINVSLHLNSKPIVGSTKIKFKIFYVLNCINSFANVSSTFFSNHQSPFVILNAAKTSSSFIDRTGDPSTCSSLWVPLSQTSGADDYSWSPIWNLNDMSGDCYFYFPGDRPAGLSKLVKISDIWKSYYRTGTETTIYEEFSKSSGPGWTAKMYRGQLVRYREITWTATDDTAEDFRYINCCFGIDGSYAGVVSNDIPLLGLGSFWVAIEPG